MKNLSAYLFLLCLMNNIGLFSQGVKKYSPEVEGVQIAFCFLSPEEYNNLLLIDKWDTINNEFSYSTFLSTETNIYKNNRTNEVLVVFDKILEIKPKNNYYIDKDSNIIYIYTGSKNDNYILPPFAILFKDKEDVVFYHKNLNFLNPESKNFQDVVIQAYIDKLQVEHLLTSFNHRSKKTRDEYIYFLGNGQVISDNGSDKNNILFNSKKEYKMYLKWLRNL